MIQLVLIPLALVAASAQTPIQSGTQSERSKHPAEQAPAERREFVVYDVGDIARMRGTPDEKSADAERRARETTRQLAELLEAFAPFSEGESMVAMPEDVSTSLGVFAGPATHAWVAEWLALQRRPVFIDVATRFLEGRRGTLLALGVDTSQSILVSSETLERVMDAAREKELSMIAAPQILMRSSERAHLSTLQHISYIKDWKLERVEPGGVEIADPVIDTIGEGMVVEVLATLLPDGHIGLRLSASHTEIQRPIPTERVRLREDRDTMVEVALPAVDRVKIETRIVLSDGATAVLYSAGHVPDEEFAVLVRAKTALPRFEGPGDEAR